MTTPIVRGFWVSVDPGDRNVGVAEWQDETCIVAYHSGPDAHIDWLVENARVLDLVVYEKWTLYPQMTAQFMGSEFMTCQMIGAMRHICRRAQIACLGYSASEHKAIYKVPEFKARKARQWMSYGQGTHAKDAECLGLYHIRKKTKQQTGW